MHICVYFLKAIEKEYQKHNVKYERGPSSRIQFKENKIHLDIPKSTCDGWTMTRLNPLLVCPFTTLYFVPQYYMLVSGQQANFFSSMCTIQGRPS